MMKCFKYLFIFFTVSIFAAVNFTNPTIVTGSAVPDLSDDTKDALYPVITTFTGQYIYALWQRKDNSTDNYTIQISKSSDFGFSWERPTTTTGNGISDLSISTKLASNPQIITDLAGRFVYAMWQRKDDNTGNFTIQFVRSSDYGVSWENPTTVTGNNVSDLSNNTKIASNPQIVADEKGGYVYVIWAREDDITNNYVIQFVKSTDFGVTWENPTTVTGNDIPDLSNNANNAEQPKITMDGTGQYVYVVWQTDNIDKHYIQVAISSDYGVTWENPITVTGNETPDLSDSTYDACNSQITTSITGKYIYVVWQIYDNDTSNYSIQLVKSTDFGVTWDYPTTVTGNATGILSENARDAINPQIIADNTGQYVYTIWQQKVSDTDNVYVIKIAKSSDYGVSWDYPTTVTGNAVGELSNNVKNAEYPKIAIDSIGQYVYSVWNRKDDKSSRYKYFLKNKELFFLTVKFFDKTIPIDLKSLLVA